MKFPDVVAEKSGKTKGGGFIGARNEVSAFGISINDDQDCISPFAFGEISEEINFQGALGMGRGRNFPTGFSGNIFV